MISGLLSHFWSINLGVIARPKPKATPAAKVIFVMWMTGSTNASDNRDLWDCDDFKVVLAGPSMLDKGKDYTQLLCAETAQHMPITT